VQRKLILILLFILAALPCTAHSQSFKGVSGKIGFSVIESGNTFENETMLRLYNRDPASRLTYLGLSGEFLYSKYFSTTIEAAFRARVFTYEYNKLNNFGQQTGTEEVQNNLNYLALTAYEKLHFDSRSMSIYFFLGLRQEIRMSEDVENDFAFYNNSAKNIFCLTSGIGFALYGSGVRFMVELNYDNDLNSMFKPSSTSPGSGKIRISEAGFKLGIGYYIKGKW
jgi:hypothetical protein